MTADGSSDPGADPTGREAPASGPGLSDADRIRAGVLACAHVADLAAGPFGEVASYLPGRSVPGVRVDEGRVEVHIVARYGPPLREVADEIGTSVRALLHGRPLSVHVDDILLPDESLAEPGDEPAADRSPRGPRAG